MSKRKKADSENQIDATKQTVRGLVQDSMSGLALFDEVSSANPAIESLTPEEEVQILVQNLDGVTSETSEELEECQMADQMADQSADQSAATDADAEIETDATADVETDVDIFLSEESSEGFLPDVSEDFISDEHSTESGDSVDLSGSELEGFESAEIEEVQFVEDERLESIVESILFASDRPVSLASIQMVFKGTNIKKDHIRRAINRLSVEYAGASRGVTLEEVTGGYQLRTKIDNMDFLRGTVKAKPFKLSGPALEVLAIVAYKQPVVKNEIDSIRGVESGHLLRALMERGLVNFEGKSELPGRPMQYGTTRRFLEIFGLRNLKELPTLSQIDELLPEGINEDEGQKKETLSSLTDSLSSQVGTSYSEGEDELLKIQDQLQVISTSTDFFEQEKLRQKMKRDAEKAQNIREAIALGEEVSTRDMNWLRKYDEALAAGESAQFQDESDASDAKNEVTTSPTEDASPDISVEEEEELMADSDELPFVDEADEVEA